MTTGMTTNGLTNCPLDGDIPLQPLLRAAEAIERARSAASKTPSLETNIYPNADFWRVEVAARLERYRTRRKPRSPRYPSLLLPFDAPASWPRPAPLTGSLETGSLETGSTETGSAETGSAAVLTAPRRANQNSNFEKGEESTTVAEPTSAEPRPASEQSAKVIEFPRSAAIPVFRPSDLADPVFDRDRPRIVEAPEILPPPPALGGMLIEPAPREAPDTRGNLLSPFPSASIARRALAALVDGAILVTALTAFAAIFLRLNPSLNPVRGPLPMLAAALGVAGVLFWVVYQFLFVVYTGSTPGLRAVRLRLVGFDGSPLDRRARCWRVLASFLSAFSAGLGYLWCVLDQDGLCWHDRITRTHVQCTVLSE